MKEPGRLTFYSNIWSKHKPAEVPLDSEKVLLDVKQGRG